MDKRQTAFFAAAAAFLILVSFLGVFYLSTTYLRTPPEISVPSQGPGLSDKEAGEAALNTKESINALAIGKTNIQNVVMSMKRPENYYSESRSTVYYGSASLSRTTKRWAYGDFTKIEVSGGGIAKTRHYILAPGYIYSWQEGDAAYSKAPTGSFGADDISQSPTYEALGEYPAASFTEGAFLAEENILLARAVGDSGYTESFWISVPTGLLMKSESKKGDTTTFFMEVTNVTVGETGKNTFTLPGGASVLP